VLAGGKSLRLGRDKALERINKLSLIERTIDSLLEVSQTVIVVTSQEQFSSITAVGLKAEVVVDLYPGKGALGGVYTGLAVSESHHNLVVACDMPFLNRDLMLYLMDLAPNFDVVVPKLDGYFEPLHAVYSKACLAPIEEILREGNMEILRLFDLVKIRYVDRDEIAKFDPQFLSFFNINTPDDLKKAEELIMQREQNVIVRKDESRL
jgi:molybdopterin-guanine dinucleotide biosynthesis protein A